MVGSVNLANTTTSNNVNTIGLTNSSSTTSTTVPYNLRRFTSNAMRLPQHNKTSTTTTTSCSSSASSYCSSNGAFSSSSCSSSVCSTPAPSPLLHQIDSNNNPSQQQQSAPVPAPIAQLCFDEEREIEEDEDEMMGVTTLVNSTPRFQSETQSTADSTLCQYQMTRTGILLASGTTKTKTVAFVTNESTKTPCVTTRSKLKMQLNAATSSPATSSIIRASAFTPVVNKSVVLIAPRSVQTKKSTTTSSVKTTTTPAHTSTSIVISSQAPRYAKATASSLATPNAFLLKKETAKNQQNSTTRPRTMSEVKKTAAAVVTNNEVATAGKQTASISRSSKKRTDRVTNEPVDIESKASKTPILTSTKSCDNTTSKSGKLVKFKQVSEDAGSSKSVKSTKRHTPPLKRFRKLRLADNQPHTPKTLMKKWSKETDTTTATSQNELPAKIDSGTMTEESAVATATQSLPPEIVITNVESNQVKEQSRPVKMLTSTEKRPLAQTPKPTRLTFDDEAMMTPNDAMDIEEMNAPSSPWAQKNSAMRTTVTPSFEPFGTLRTRLFDDDAMPNKALNFDDNSGSEDDEMNQLFRGGRSRLSSNATKSKSMSTSCSMPGSSMPTPLSFGTTTSSHTGSNGQLFRPINRIKQHHQQMTQQQRTSSISSLSSLNSNLHSRLGVNAGNLADSKSPHSPFANDQQAININPFTPTVLSLDSRQTMSLRREQNLLDSSSVGVIGGSVKRTHNDEDEEEDDTELGVPGNIMLDDNNEDGLLLHRQQQQQHHAGSSARSNKRLALRQCLVSRYHEEFHEVCKLGSGEFGDVFKCINRLDGCTYAIKRSKKPIAGSALEMQAWKEVCAHAVLVKHNHIVQYYSAWAEADRMLIQNEYCNGGSLAEHCDKLKKQLRESSGINADEQQQLARLMTERDLRNVLLHIAKGLAYMHTQNLVHLDIKPGNIFICCTPVVNPRRRSQLMSRKVKTEETAASRAQSAAITANTNTNELLFINEESGIESTDELEGMEALMSGDEENGLEPAASSVFADNMVITYKIGDLGHVTSTLDPHVEEGDCRYLPNEILQEQYDHLPKADVFALALTVFVAGSLEELPKNGDEWHWIRRGNLKPLEQCSSRFNQLLNLMVHENPTQRPSAGVLLNHPLICPDACKSRAQLRKELNREKFKNEMLQRQVKRYEEQICKNTINGVSSSTTTTTNPITKASKQPFGRSLSSSLL